MIDFGIAELKPHLRVCVNWRSQRARQETVVSRRVRFSSIWFQDKTHRKLRIGEIPSVSLVKRNFSLSSFLVTQDCMVDEMFFWSKSQQAAAPTRNYSQSLWFHTSCVWCAWLTSNDIQIYIYILYLCIHWVLPEEYFGSRGNMMFWCASAQRFFGLLRWEVPT